MRNEHERFLTSIVNDVLHSAPGATKSAVVFKSLALSNTSYKHMLAEMKSVFDRFAAISERAVKEGEMSERKAIFACGPSLEAEQRQLARITC